MEIIEKVKALNTKANNLNKKREKALWERNKAKEELTKAIADYKAKYGVELTEEKIAEEFNTVLKDITAKAEKLEKDIKTIESGGSIGGSVADGAKAENNGAVAKAESAVKVENGNGGNWTTNTSYDQYNDVNNVNGANQSGFNPYMTGGANSSINGGNSVSNSTPATAPVSNSVPQNSGTTFEEWQAKMLGFDKKEEVEEKKSSDGFNPQFDFRKYIE